MPRPKLRPCSDCGKPTKGKTGLCRGCKPSDRIPLKCHKCTRMTTRRDLDANPLCRHCAGPGAKALALPPGRWVPRRGILVWVAS